MKRLTVKDCMSRRFKKVLDNEHPPLDSKQPVYAVFTSTRDNPIFCGLVRAEDVAIQPTSTFSIFVSPRPLVFVKTTTTARQALTLMKKSKQDMLPVFNIDEDLVGIIIKTDLLRLLYQHEHAQLVAARKEHILLLDEIQKRDENAKYFPGKVDALHPDPLTGLPNLAQIREKIKTLLLSSVSKNKLGVLLLVDLDDFRVINDTMSSYFGDLILQQICTRIAGHLRSTDLLARKGGDEFVVVLDDIKSIENAIDIANIILKALAHPFTLSGQDIYLTASIGMSSFSSHAGNNVENLLANADIALQQAKEYGKNNYQVFAQMMGDRAHQEQNKVRHLRHAIQRDELFLCYQPQIDVKNYRMVGVEALLRWNSPALGLVMPNDFISIAEDNGLILPFGDWVMRRACEQAKEWQQQWPELRVAINISVRQFEGIHTQTADKFIHRIALILEETNFSPSLLEVEITESILMKNYSAAMSMLKKLKNLGVRISCDDFGTGFSALNYLKQFPMDTIKIDKSFIDDIVHNPIDVAIIEAIIVMAKQLHIEVIAEGVETEAQLRILEALGCDIVQGYFFSKPLSKEDVTSALKSGLAGL